MVDETDAEITRGTLTLGSPKTAVVLARMARNGNGWRLRALAEPVPVKLPTESERALKRLL